LTSFYYLGITAGHWQDHRAGQSWLNFDQGIDSPGLPERWNLKTRASVSYEAQNVARVRLRGVKSAIERATVRQDG
jgi:hypothetical protein